MLSSRLIARRPLDHRQHQGNQARASGEDSKALAKASITMAKPDLWHARLAVKTLRRDQRRAIAEAAES